MRTEQAILATGPLTDEEVPAYARALGLPGLADIHVHFLPDRVLHKVWGYFDRHGWKEAGDWPIHYRYDEPTRLRIVRALGMRGVPSLTYPHKPGMAAWLNEWCADFARRVPDAVPSATFYPEPEAEAYVRAALDRGARLFKVHLQVGDYDPNDPLLDPVWGMLQDAGVPVVIHAGSGPRHGQHTGPGLVAELLRRFPRLVLVVAHLGMPEYEGFADLAERFEGVHLDTTMAATDYVERHLPLPASYVARLGDLGHKVVLGADFPNIPYPYAHQIEALVRLGHGAEWLRAVLWENGARLMRLG
ncbi:MAG TPA: amidohydrolase family protein [Ornithinicoccus sp.]|nr:amidohydrolase family protein [Ornithinicoccus sp.]